VAVSSATTVGFVLPFNVFSQGLTLYSLPPLNNEKYEYFDNGWNLTFSANH
jgi:hypothetical protein